MNKKIVMTTIAVLGTAYMYCLCKSVQKRAKEYAIENAEWLQASNRTDQDRLFLDEADISDKVHKEVTARERAFVKNAVTEYKDYTGYNDKIAEARSDAETVIEDYKETIRYDATRTAITQSVEDGVCAFKLASGYDDKCKEIDDRIASAKAQKEATKTTFDAMAQLVPDNAAQIDEFKKSSTQKYKDMIKDAKHERKELDKTITDKRTELASEAAAKMAELDEDVRRYASIAEADRDSKIAELKKELRDKVAEYKEEAKQKRTEEEKIYLAHREYNRDRRTDILVREHDAACAAVASEPSSVTLGRYLGEFCGFSSSQIFLILCCPVVPVGYFVGKYLSWVTAVCREVAKY